MYLKQCICVFREPNQWLCLTGTCLDQWVKVMDLFLISSFMALWCPCTQSCYPLMVTHVQSSHPGASHKRCIRFICVDLSYFDVFLSHLDLLCKRVQVSRDAKKHPPPRQLDSIYDHYKTTQKENHTFKFVSQLDSIFDHYKTAQKENHTFTFDLCLSVFRTN